MSTSSPRFPRRAAGNVIAVTLDRHRAVLAGGFMTLAGLAQACSAPAGGAGPDDPNAGVGPTTVSADASAPAQRSPDAGSPAKPPAKDCVLAGPPASSAGDTLVWSDEFSGSVVDYTKWYIHANQGRPGDALNSFTREAISVHDGSLFVTASATPDDPVQAYTSGRIDTFGRFARTYGKVEFRARFPYAPGVWYAVWGKPQTATFPEIDVEILGKNSTQVWFVNHWGAPPLPRDQTRKFVTVPEIDITQFHVYTIVWKPDLVEWQIDGMPYMQSTGAGVPSTPVAWTINGWVGGWGASNTTPAVPATFEVDYFRVYRQDGLIAEPAIRVMNPKAQYATTSDGIDVEPSNFDEACFHVEVYEGTKILETLRPWPYRFAPKSLASGAHTLTFVATDGVRRASTSLDIEIL